MTPGEAWLWLYYCASEILCDPAKRREEADAGLQYYMEKFDERGQLKDDSSVG